MSTWTLQTVQYQAEDKMLAAGTEAEVKAEAGRLFTRAYESADGMEAAAMLFADLYITKPDGSHQGTFTSDPDGFGHGEMPQWADVDW